MTGDEEVVPIVTSSSGSRIPTCCGRGLTLSKPLNQYTAWYRHICLWRLLPNVHILAWIATNVIEPACGSQLSEEFSEGLVLVYLLTSHAVIVCINLKWKKKKKTFSSFHWPPTGKGTCVHITEHNVVIITLKKDQGVVTESSREDLLCSNSTFSLGAKHMQ